MKMSEKTVRRGLYGMFAGGLLAFGSAAIVMPVVNAQPAPGPGTGTSELQRQRDRRHLTHGVGVHKHVPGRRIPQPMTR